METIKIEPDWFLARAENIMSALLEARKEIGGKIEAMKTDVEHIEDKVRHGIPIEQMGNSVYRMNGYIAELELALKKLDAVEDTAYEIKMEVKRLRGKTVLPFS